MERFAFGEFRYVIRLMIIMHLIDVTGFLCFKFGTLSTHRKHVQMDDLEVQSKMRKVIEDKMINKTYMRD